MNLQKISDHELMSRTEGLVREEKALLARLLHHLREVNRRKLYSDMGYESLYDFGIKHLRYSEDQIYRRIAAMKMLEAVPEIEQKIIAGELTLSHIGVAHSLFTQEKKIHSVEMSPLQKLEVINAISNKSVRAAEKVVLALSSQPVSYKPDRVYAVSESHVEIKFTAPAELQQKIETLKGWLAHKNPNITMAELLDQLCDLALENWNPAKPLKTATSRKPCVTSNAQVRRDVFASAKSRCEKCGSSHGLEIDHIYPKAWGGGDERENLRLLCRNCNQRSAIRLLGVRKVEQATREKMKH